MGIKLRQSTNGRELVGTIAGQVPVWNPVTQEWDVGSAASSPGLAFGIEAPLAPIANGADGTSTPVSLVNVPAGRVLCMITTNILFSAIVGSLEFQVIAQADIDGAGFANFDGGSQIIQVIDSAAPVTNTLRQITYIGVLELGAAAATLAFRMLVANNSAAPGNEITPAFCSTVIVPGYVAP